MKTFPDNIHELIGTLFWGLGKMDLRLFRIQKGQETDMGVAETVPLHELTSYRKRGDRDILVGVEVEDWQGQGGELEEIFRRVTRTAVKGVYLVVKERRLVDRIVRRLQELSPVEAEVYGIDPDYFFSIVPLTTKSKRKIENYVLNLKSETTIRGRVKFWVKKILIALRFGDLLYDGFLVTAVPFPEAHAEG